VIETTRELLAQSLYAWRLAGEVTRVSEDAIDIVAPGKTIRVERAPAEAPLRWLVSVEGRRRGALALPAVLRQVRGALDPGYARSSARIAAAPLVPS
jgi:hypothetical protein